MGGEMKERRGEERGERRGERRGEKRTAEDDEEDEGMDRPRGRGSVLDTRTTPCATSLPH